MIRVKVDINGRDVVTDVYAVRIHPVNSTPLPGQLCKYELFVDKNYKLTFKYPYGDGVALAIEMLKMSEKDDV